MVLGSALLPLMDPEGMESDFPCLPSTKRVSFALHSGGRETLDLVRIPASPVTPNFQSDFVHGILGAQQSVVDTFSSLSSNGGSPIPLLDLKQSALVSIEKLSAKSDLCCEDVNSVNSASFWTAVEVPDELALAGILNLRALEHESGDVGCNLRQEVPGAAPGQHQDPGKSALPASGSGLLGAPSVDLLQDSQNRARPSSVIHLERREECGEKSIGRSWSSVVTQNSFEGIVFMVAVISRCRLLLVIKQSLSLNGGPCHPLPYLVTTSR